MKILFSIIILLLFSFCTSENSRKSPLAEKGTMDLRLWDFRKDGRVSLYGEWEFYYGQFISPEEFQKKAFSADYIQVPSLWNVHRAVSGEFLSNQGYATYRLAVYVKENMQTYGFRIGDMYSAYRMWVNGIEIAANGSPGKNQMEEKAEWYPVVSFVHLKEGKNEIVIHLSNHSHRKGGTWSDFELGFSDEISDYKHWLISFDFFLIGSLLIMAVYHFGLYTLRRSDISSLLLGLLCIFSTLRIGVTGERLLVPHLPFRSFETQVKLEYISFFLSVAVFPQFILILFQEKRSRAVMKLIWAIVAGATALTLFTRAVIYSHTAIPMQVLILLEAVYLFYVMTVSVSRKSEGAVAAFSGMLILLFTIVLEILYQNEVSIFSAIPPIYVFPFGVFMFLFSQSFLLSQRFSKAFASVEQLSNYLLQTNDVFSKFVPVEFLEHLNRENALDIRLGDQVQRDMTILFSDIRDFTSLSETMTPSENFNFINSYLKRMNPYIQDNSGFIDKYIGDAIMALFPRNAEDAVRAAVEMCREVKLYNEDRVLKNYRPIQVGFGIHSGSLMLGIIGASSRMDSTVISDSVNLASRLEGLTKEYRVPLIVSESVIRQIENTERFHYRLLDHVNVKGKLNSAVVYHVYDGQDPEEIILLDSIRKDFESGVKSFHSGDYNNAYKFFRKTADLYPGDYPTVLYLQRCSEKIGAAGTSAE